jgi:hypothetical protein
VPSLYLRDLVRGGDCCCRRLRCATPTVNKVLSLRDMRIKPCKGDTLLTVCFSLRAGKRYLSTESRQGRHFYSPYTLFISHLITKMKERNIKMKLLSINSFSRLLVYLFSRLLVYLFTRLLVYSFTCLLVYLFTRLLVHSFNCSLVYLFTCLLVYSFTCLLVYLTTDSK